jgi:hypothetical protein
MEPWRWGFPAREEALQGGGACSVDSDFHPCCWDNLTRDSLTRDSLTEAHRRLLTPPNLTMLVLSICYQTFFLRSRIIIIIEKHFKASTNMSYL